MRKVILCCLVVLMTACASSKPTKFYSLTPVKDSNAEINNNRKLNIGIDYISVPGYLERPQIVTIKNENELNLSEFDRWAEPIANSMQRIVATNMSASMKNTMIRPASSNRRLFDYIVSIEINQFDGKFGDKVTLDAWWTITNKDGKVLANEHSSFEILLGDDYDNLVEKQSVLINKLSIEIAKKINKLR